MTIISLILAFFLACVYLPVYYILTNGFAFSVGFSVVMDVLVSLNAAYFFFCGAIEPALGYYKYPNTTFSCQPERVKFRIV